MVDLKLNCIILLMNLFHYEKLAVVILFHFKTPKEAPNLNGLVKSIHQTLKLGAAPRGGQSVTPSDLPGRPES